MASFKEGLACREPLADRSASDDIWNRFINEYCTCYSMREDLTPVQRIAVLCFNYEAEMCSGGYVSYHDMYPDVPADEMAQALRVVHGEAMAENYLKAVQSGAADDYIETDMTFYRLEPSLGQATEAYVRRHRTDFFAEE